jgi:hypothetical protein
MREGFMLIFDLNINLLATDADNLVVYRHLCLSLLIGEIGKRGASMAAEIFTFAQRFST